MIPDPGTVIPDPGAVISYPGIPDSGAVMIPDPGSVIRDPYTSLQPCFIAQSKAAFRFYVSFL